MPNSNPVAAWKALKEGNERFVAGALPASRAKHRGSREASCVKAEPTGGSVRLRSRQAGRPPEHHLSTRASATCSWCVLPGHTSSTRRCSAPSSAAVAVLDVPLVVVTGPRQLWRREGDAVGASTTARWPGGFVRDIVERITPTVLQGRLAGTRAGRRVRSQARQRHRRAAADPLRGDAEATWRKRAPCAKSSGSPPSRRRARWKL